MVQTKHPGTVCTMHFEGSVPQVSFCNGGPADVAGGHTSVLLCKVGQDIQLTRGNKLDMVSHCDVMTGQETFLMLGRSVFRY